MTDETVLKGFLSHATALCGFRRPCRALLAMSSMWGGTDVERPLKPVCRSARERDCDDSQCARYRLAI